MERFRWKSTDGNAAVEFGLVLPLLLLVLLGIMDWGQVHFSRVAMTNAAREGARAGVVQATPNQAVAAAEEAAHDYLASSSIQDADVQATLVDGSTLDVRVTLKPFDPLIGFVPTPDQLESNASMRWELAPVSL